MEQNFIPDGRTRVLVKDIKSKYYLKEMYVYQRNQYWVWLASVQNGGPIVVVAANKVMNI